MSDLRSVTVFCGSSPGADPAFAEATRELARLLASSTCGSVEARFQGSLPGAAMLRERGLPVSRATARASGR